MQRFAASLRLALAFLFMGALAATPLFAVPATGSLHGAVTDPSGARVVKVTVAVQAGDGTASTGISGADGTYLFPQLAPGTYTIPVPARVLALPQAKGVTVEAGRATL